MLLALLVLLVLSFRIFHLLSTCVTFCSTLNQSYELIDYLRSTYVYAAQYNQPPRYPVSMICGGIDGESLGSDILSKIYAGIVALRGNSTCKVNGPTNVSETTVGWRWQVIALIYNCNVF